MWRDIDSWTYGEATRAHARFTVDHDVTRMREGGVNGWRCGFVRDVGVRRDGTQYTFLRSLTHREVEEGTRRLNRREMLLELREQRGMRVPRLAPAGNGRLLDGIGVKVAAIGRVLRKWQAEAGQSRIYDKKWEFIIKPTWYAERPFPSKLLAFVALGKDEGFVGVEFVDVKDLSWIVQKAMDQLSDEGFTIIQPKTYLNALYYRRKLRGIKAMGAVPNLPSLPISPADRAISLVRFEGIAAGLENIAGKPEVRHRPIAPDPNTPPTPTRAQSASKKTRPISYAAAAASANPPQAQTYAEQCNTDPRLRPATDLFGVAFPPSSKSAIDKAVAAANKAAQLVKKTATITKRYAPVMPLILRPPNKKVRVDSAPPVNVSTLREDEAAGEDTRMADGGLSEAQKLRRTTARHTDNWRDPDPAGNTNGSESDDIGDMSRFIGMDF